MLRIGRRIALMSVVAAVLLQPALAEPPKFQVDPTWPLTNRGLILASDTVLVKADNLWQALGYGTEDTLRFIRNIYQGLVRVVTGRVSSKTFGGPKR